MTNKFEILRMSPENTNSLLVSSGDACVIFDAWGRVDDWVRILTARGLRPCAVYSTHGHPDHISAAADLAARYGVDWYLGAADWPLVGWGNDILDYFGLPRINGITVSPTDIIPGATEILPGIEMHTIATPGHSPGGHVFYFPKFKLLMTGDTLFAGGIGRYDLPGGDAAALRRSLIRVRELNLGDDTITLHGHGPESTIGALKKENPYFTARI